MILTTEQEETKWRSEARKHFETVEITFVIGKRRRYQVARMKIYNRVVAASENFEPVREANRRHDGSFRSV